MKKALIAFGALVVLLIVAALAAPAFIPAEKIKAQAIEQVKAATGRDLAIDGKLSVSVFPTLAVQLGTVSLANPPGFKAKDLVRLDGIDVRVKLLPLLSGKVEVDSFVLDHPVINLEVDPQGHADWEFAAAHTAAPAPAAPAAPAAKPADGKAAAAPLSDIRLGDIRITGGKLVYADAKAGTTETVDAIDLQLSLPGLDQPLAVKGGLTWRGQQIMLSVDLARPRALTAAEGNTAMALAVTAQALKLGFNGDIAGATRALTGSLDLSVPSVRGLVGWVSGKPLEMAGSGLGPLSIKGRLAADRGRYGFTQAALQLDAIKANGDFSVDTTGARPAAKATLAVDMLDLNPYLPPESAEAKPAAAASGGTGGGGNTAAAKQDWSDDPIDASGLKAAEADLTLTTGGLKIRRIEIGKSQLGVALHGGKLAVDLAEMTLYKGQGKGRLAVDGSQPGAGIDAAFTLKGLQAQPFLAAAAGTDRLEGTANADLQVNGRGHSQRQIVSSLGGKGTLSFLDGAIHGINLGAMLRNVTTAFSDSGGDQKTDFAELGGSFTIASGIVSNQDLALKAPLFRVAGAGTVDLPKRSLNYRIEPKVAATTEGQGGKQDVGGLSVPVIIEGPWSNLSYRPDLAGLVKGNVGNAVKGLMDKAIPGKGGQLPINPGALFGR